MNMSRMKVIDMEVDVTNLEATLNKVESLSETNRASYVCVSNVHMCIEVLILPEKL